MANNNNSDVALTSQIAYLYLLFGAPLVATVEADVMAAVKFVEFIKKYGFENDGNGNGDPDVEFGQLRMITFTYDREEVVNGEVKTVTVTVTIPLISLFPLPLLQVKDAAFKFDIQIVSLSGEISKQPNLLGGGAKRKKAKGPGNGLLPVQDFNVLATLSPLTSETGEAKVASNLYANMKVEINMRQADIPSGIATLINVISDSNYSREEKAKEDEDKNQDKSSNKTKTKTSKKEIK